MVICSQYKDVIVSYDNIILKNITIFKHRIILAFIYSSIYNVLNVPFKKGTSIHLNFGERPIMPIKTSKAKVIWILSKPKALYDFSQYNYIFCIDKEYSDKNGFYHLEPGLFYETDDSNGLPKSKYSYVGNLDKFVRKVSGVVDVIHYGSDKFHLDLDLFNQVALVSEYIITPVFDFIPLEFYNIPYYSCMILSEKEKSGILKEYIRTPKVKINVNWDMQPYEHILLNSFIEMKDIIYGV